MTSQTAAPFGSWQSPISAADLAASSHPVGGGRFVGDEIWFTEQRPDQEGRYSVRRVAGPGVEPAGVEPAGVEPMDILPAPWNARSRVHEYGGTSWVPYEGGLVCVEFSDQRLYVLAAGASDPAPLTPAAGGMRFCDFHVRGSELIAVREIHDSVLTRDICAVPLDGSGASDPEAIRSVVSGSHFLAYPRFSPDGSKLAWIAWEHPQMPWDGTELRVGSVVDGIVADWNVLIGSTTESVLQPSWDGPTALFAISDRTGWWNLYRVGLDGTAAALHCEEADFAGPLWTLGSQFYREIDAGLLTVRTFGTDSLGILDVETGSWSPLAPELTTVSIGDSRDDLLLLTGGSAALANGLRMLNTTSGELAIIRLSVDSLPAAQYLPIAESRTFVGAQREVHTFVYPPRNPSFRGLPEELPPYVAFVHGGPTAHESGSLKPVFAYFTSRGIGVIDVNYGGSTGYGREYRNRLRGQWGVLDVQDVVTAVLGLADAGLADRRRLAIEGGSAGGWTVLAALTSSDVFACGASYYGVAELEQFIAETHDFESRYIDGLIGQWPAAADLYRERAPLSHVDQLSCPVLLLQGLDDPVVPPSQAERFRDALVQKQIPHAYLTFEGESHGFRRTETLVKSREAEISFYGQVMGFVPAGVPMLPLEFAEHLPQ